MKRLLLVAALAAIAIGGVALAQVVSGPPKPVALVCAYNASPPTATPGQFFYVQCDSSGHLITSGGAL